MTDKLPERLWQKVRVDTDTGCWLWTADCHHDGYGRFWFDGRRQPAHRVSYEAHKGNIPYGIRLVHLCRNRNCVNPDHWKALTLLERFMKKVRIDPDTGCWLWTAHCHHDGYGVFRLDGRMQMAHRVSYEAHVGPIPEGLQIDHLCRIRNCVNPEHLEAVTGAENVRRAYSAKREKAKTHCPTNTNL